MQLQITTAILAIASVCQTVKGMECDYTLYNKDFDYGTFRITKRGVYCLGENISMNPRPGSPDDPNHYGAWFPIHEDEYPGCASHDGGGWALGFFSAISIESSDVTLDLQGYKMEMSRVFYLQQRFFNIIEIQNAAFNFGTGPANFGQTIDTIENVHITNGELGRTSHNGIHAFDVINVYVSDLKIHTFEVAGIQFNGFKEVHIRNVDIGPSSTEVPFLGYYSHGRFSLNGFDLVKEKDSKYIRFKGKRELTAQQIYANLRRSLDIAFKSAMGILTEADKEDPLYEISIKMYENKLGVPDGSVIYGMIFNSKALAVGGFGDSDNEDERHGNILNIENVNINGLHLNLNEIPAIYFDRCEGHYFNEEGGVSLTPILGRFGDVFDLRKTLAFDKWDYIDDGFFSYNDLIYGGNPLSDAQIALNIFSDPFETNWGIDTSIDADIGSETLFRWATDNGDKKYDSLPYCARFACNGDAMFHLNKGLIGIRLDGIENVIMKDISINKLYNKSPLGSLACGLYDGPSNGQAQPRGLEKEGVMSTSVRGIALCNGGGMELYGKIKFTDLISNNGEVIGIHIMDDASIHFDEPNQFEFVNLEPGAVISYDMYNRMNRDGVYPYPNNFYVCNVRCEHLEDRKHPNYPYYYTEKGGGCIYPKGAIIPECFELYYDQNQQRSKKNVYQKNQKKKKKMV